MLINITDVMLIMQNILHTIYFIHVFYTYIKYNYIQINYLNHTLMLSGHFYLNIQINYTY